ncbi:MAG: hypothetical protein JWN44_7336, partial [Myxococcales bacterium]|nr:hypothetical protein [Myxococcales bacterium]
AATFAAILALTAGDTLATSNAFTSIGIFGMSIADALAGSDGITTTGGSNAILLSASDTLTLSDTIGMVVWSIVPGQGGAWTPLPPTTGSWSDVPGPPTGSWTPI